MLPIFVFTVADAASSVLTVYCTVVILRFDEQNWQFRYHDGTFDVQYVLWTWCWVGQHLDQN